MRGRKKMKLVNWFKMNFIWFLIFACAVMIFDGVRDVREFGESYSFEVHGQTAEGVATEDLAAAAMYYGDAVRLSAGSYRVVVDTVLSDDLTALIEICSDDAPYGALQTNLTPMYAGQAQCIYDFTLKSEADVYVTISRGETQVMQIGAGSFVRSAQHGWYRILIGAVLMMVLLLIYRKREALLTALQEREVRAVWVLLALLCVLVSLPLAVDYLWTGADETFHLLRIEGIREGLLDGQFPVRMQPNWLQGHGYAVGFFYCDLFLYLPAVLRLVGVSVQRAYQVYKVAVNIGTVLIAYVSFAKLLRSRWLGLLGSALYSLSLFRIIYLFSVDGVGQYTAVMFLPLVCYGFYAILAPAIAKEHEVDRSIGVKSIEGDAVATSGDRTLQSGDCRFRTGRRLDLRFLPLALGMSGIIESHVLTCLMVVIFGVLLCLICIRRVLHADVILNLVKAVGLFLLLNAWYLIPMADYSMAHDFAVLEGNATLKQIQTYGMYFTQLFDFFPSGGLYGAFSMDSGANGEIAYSIGIGLTVALVISLLLLTVHRSMLQRLPETERRAFGISMILGLIALWISGVHFPWDKIAKAGSLIRQLIATVQFPNRFVAVAEVLLTLMALYAVRILYLHRPRLAVGAAVLMVCGAAATSAYYLDTQQANAGFFRIYDEVCMGNGYISGGEYVLLGTDVSKLTYGSSAAGEGVTIRSLQQEGTHVTCDVENVTAAESYIEVPLLYYKGYQAQDATGSALAVSIGDNNVLRIAVPAAYSGEIRVQFTDLWYWRLSEVVSLISLVAVCVLYARGRVQRRKTFPAGGSSEV